MNYIMSIKLSNAGPCTNLVSMKLYTNPISPNSRKARAVARHIGLDVDEIGVDLKGGEQKSEAFLKKNPNGMVPVLEDGDLTLFESNAIALYLGDRPSSSLSLASPAERAEVVKWLSWEGWHLAHPVLDLAFERIIKGMVGAGPPDEAVVEKSLEGWARFGAVLDRELSGRTFVLGDDVSIADFCLGACFTFARPSELPLSGVPHVERWLGAMDELPAWRDTAPPMG